MRHFAAAAIALAASLAFAATAGADAWLGEGNGVPTGYSPKDFTIVQRYGLFHAFYILTNPSLRAGNTSDQHRNETRFGHSVSSDLVSWTFIDSAFTVSADGFDRDHIWSPQIVEADSLYWMFYTGVTDSLVGGMWKNAIQAIGLATSPDLIHWTRRPLPVFACGAPYSPWATCGEGGLRDPFVMPVDPTVPGAPESGWWMYFTTQPATAPLYHYDAFAFLVGTSVCIGDDLGDWSDLGPMWSSYRTYQSGPDQTNKVESPHLFKHGGQWYLFFTGEQGIYYLTGPNPVGDIPVHAGLWTYQGLLEETLPSEFASEAFRARWADGTTEDYFATVRSTGAYKFIIQFRAFNPSGSAPLLVDPLMPREVRPLRAGVVEGETLGVALRTELPSVGGTLGITMQRSAPITVFEVDESNGERSLSIIDPASIGMPSVAHVTTNYLAGDDGDTLRFVARWLPDDDDTPNRDEVVIRVRGFDSAVLAIQRAGTGQVLGVDSQALQANRVTLSPIGSAAGGSEARLRAGVPRSGVVKLEIFDAGGRRVRMLARGWRDAGFHEERWDGRDDGGKRTPSGVYFARLTTPDGSASARVARLR